MFMAKTLTTRKTDLSKNSALLVSRQAHVIHSFAYF